MFLGAVASAKRFSLGEAMFDQIGLLPGSLSRELYWVRSKMGTLLATVPWFRTDPARKVVDSQLPRCFASFRSGSSGNSCGQRMEKEHGFC